MSNPGTRRQWVLAVLDRYEAPLVRYAARLLGDGDSAREAVQHAFLQLCECSPEEFRNGHEAPWLFRVCRNKAMDLIRLRQRHTGDTEADLATLVGREPDPAELAERQDLCGELARLVAQLPASQREAIDLWCEGFSYREISAIADQSEGNVRVLVHRAIKQLRQVLKVTNDK
ncbi:MAG: sigma-70 family RNA polymerase sigma factor [Thermoguttaceae bacterium]|jgi:RNA polymerase sigma-70 factor (ECF subfamily)